MLGQPWWYWLLFALAALLLLVGVPLAAWWERRARARDRQRWDQWRGPRDQDAYQREYARTAAGQMETLQEAGREFGRAFRDALKR